MARPSAQDYPPYFERYISLVGEDDLLEALRSSLAELVDFLEAIPADKAEFRYAPGKWTIKELLQHIIDTERIFSYRALCFARKEKQNLPGFDENDYALNADVAARNLKDLKKELLAVRETVYLMFRGFTNDMLSYPGLSNNNPATVNAVGYMILGHVRHHFNIIKERYI